MFSQSIKQYSRQQYLPPHLVVAGAAGLILGVAVLALGPTMALGLMAGLIVAVAAFTWPELVILLLLAFASGLAPARFNPYLRLAGRGFFLSDMVLILLLAVIAFRFIADRSFRFRKTPLDLPLLLFCAAIIIGMVTAVLNHGILFKDTTYQARILLYYLTFFAVTNLVRTRPQLIRLIHGIFVIGLLAAGTIVIQAAVGRSVSLVEGSFARGEGLIRFYHPGALAIYVALMALICDVAIREDRRRRVISLLSLPVLGLALLAMQGRNILISSAISLAVLLVILPGFQLSRLAGRLFVAAGITIALAAVLGITGNTGWLLQYFTAYFGRLSHMFSSPILSPEETLAWRWKEIQYAWAHIAQSPIFGIGLETPYKPAFYKGDQLTSYIHNAYLWLWLKTGLLGLVAFLWLSVRFLVRGFQHWRDSEDHFLRAVTLGFTLAYLALTLSNLVAPSFVQGWSLAVYAAIMGVNEVAFAQSKPLPAL